MIAPECNEATVMHVYILCSVDTMFRQTRNVGFAILIALFAFACGEPHTHMAEVDNRSPSDGTGGGPGGGGGQFDGDYLLEATSATEFEVSLGATVSIGVALIDAGGQPAGNEAVEYEFLTTTGDSAIQLDAPTIFTGPNGEAPNRVAAGGEPGTIEVRATHPDAGNAVDFTIEVTTVPAGDLNVAVAYDDANLMEISDIEVRYWRTYEMECAFIGPYALPPEPYLDTATLPTVDDDVTFHSLQNTHEYTVTVTGHGPQGQIATHGCIDDIEIVADQTTDLVVDLNLLDLRANGTYEILSTWDFSDALASSGPVGAAIVDTFEWIANPGDMIAAYVADLLVDWVCDEYGTISWQCGAALAAQAEGSAESALAGFIDDQIDNIGILSDFQDMANDLRRIVEELTVESVLTIDGKTSSGLDVRGTDTWRAVYVYWTRGCDADDPPDCGEIRLGLGDSTQFGLIEGSWDGHIEDYDHLEIYPHDMVIPYGKLITHILRQHLIPWLTGGEASSLSGAFEYLLCDNLGGFSIWGVSVDASTMQGFCNMAFGTIGTLGEIYIHNLEYDVDLSIGGFGQLIDFESDGRADVIDGGMFFGELEGEDGQSVEMEAEFSGARID